MGTPLVAEELDPAASRPSPRIYVYDMPTWATSWLAAHYRRATMDLASKVRSSSTGRWDQMFLYALDIKLHRWLLRSRYREVDARRADYFFVPAYLSLGFYDMQYGLYWLTGRGVRMLGDILRYVKPVGPFFNQP